MNILRDKKTVFVKEWIDNDIFYIRQLVKEDGTFMIFNDFEQIYPFIKKNTNFIVYAGILNAIQRFQRKLNINLISKYKIHKPKIWTCIEKVTNMCK
jgi:hypothetical protein